MIQGEKRINHELKHMTIQRPYIRQIVNYPKENINAWSKETFDGSSSITSKLQNKTWLISPMDGVAGKEVHHHKIKIYFNGPHPNIILAHSHLPQLDEVRSTAHYSLGPYSMQNGIEINIPMPYGGRKYTWILIENVANLDIQSIEHSYWRCPNDRATYNGQEGPFFLDHCKGQMPYFIGYPADYDSSENKKYPLFISCAGSDTIGCDGKKGRNQVDPAWIIFRHYQNIVKHPAFLVTVQAGFCAGEGMPRPDLPFSPFHDGWYNTYGPEGFTATGVLALIDYFIKHPDYNIDENRIYFGGFSGGGKLAFSLRQSGREVFAAIAPTSAWAIGGAYQDVSQRSDYIELKERLDKETMRGIHIPMMVGVGTKDAMIYGSKLFKETSDRLGGECRYQEYINSSHGQAPKDCFNDFSNVDWLFSKTKQQVPNDPYPNYDFNYKALPGDINSDGFVGLDDLNIVLSAWNKRKGEKGYDVNADINKDGFIGLDDLNHVLTNWGRKK